jgi:hypothetical protein
LFDAQILGIFKLINAQLDRFGDVVSGVHAVFVTRDKPNSSFF